MKCPFCGNSDTRVVDSRDTGNGDSIRRRRECPRCGKRFTTYEYVELREIFVVKKDGRREPFSREKLRRGITKACEKRPIGYDKINRQVDKIEQRLRSQNKPEVPSSKIGDMVMAWLKRVDKVAYIRFASVYRQFKDINTFLVNIKDLTHIRMEFPNKS